MKINVDILMLNLIYLCNITRTISYIVNEGTKHHAPRQVLMTLIDQFRLLNNLHQDVYVLYLMCYCVYFNRLMD